VIVQSLVARLVDLWSEQTWMDYAATAIVVTPYFLVTKFVRHSDWLRSISADQRLAIYGTGATIISIIGGLSAVAITIYVAADGGRARAVRESKNRYLRRNWRALFVGLGVSSLACLAAQAIDAPHDLLSSRIVFVAAMIFAIWRFIRLVWLFDAIIGIADRDLTDSKRIKAPPLGTSWRSK
jgi:hypothetical protein